MVFQIPVRAGIIPAVRSAARRGDLAKAEQLVRRYLDENGSTPKAMEALSWVARGALEARRFSKASDYAKQVHRSVLRRLRDSNLDSEPHMATALGVLIEALAQAMTGQGRRTEAVALLRREVARFECTSIRFRIRKNLNLFTMQGQRPPELDSREWIGPKPRLLGELCGLPVLLFFWAHYCEDSRAQGRVLVRICERFAGSGLSLIRPTRRYGHLDEQGLAPARRAQEMQHIEEVLDRYYGDLTGMPVPVSVRNFENYGVSTTPTLALVDRSGIVSLYDPGKLPYSNLASKTRSVLNSGGYGSIGTRAGASS
jgi:hypothetical protein